MISQIDSLIIFISSFVGSIIVLITSIIAIKYGSIAGIITTIPTNTLVSLLGISINNNNKITLQKNIFISIIIILSCIPYLLLFWIRLPIFIQKYNFRFQIAITTISSIIFYIITTSLIYTLIMNTIYNNLNNQQILLLAIISTFLYYYISSIHTFIYYNNNESIDQLKSTSTELFYRFIVTFIVIGMIILIAKINETIGVIMSVFPLISLLNSIIVWNKTQNNRLISNLNSTILLSGISILVYVLIYGYLIDKMQLYYNVPISFIISFSLFNIPIYFSFIKLNKPQLYNTHQITNI